MEFVQGNLTAGGGAANGSARPMQFGFLGQVGSLIVGASWNLLNNAEGDYYFRYTDGLH